MKIRIKLFAAARQTAARDQIELELPAGATVADVRTALLQRLPALAPIEAHIRFAVGRRYASDQTTVEPGDEVACIPPVSGG